MKVRIDLESNWKVIEELLPSAWRALAGAHGLRFDAPKETGAKIRDPSVLLRLLLHHACTGVSLATTVAAAASIGLVDISANALHGWMKTSGAWLASLACAMLEQSSRFAPALWAGYEVIVADATTVQRPGSKETTARVHCALRLLDLMPAFIKVTDDSVGETLRNFVMRAGQLWLLDRGYANPPGIAHAAAGGATLLVRYNFGSLPLFDAKGDRLDVRALVSGDVKRDVVTEWDVWVHPRGKDPIAGRLLATRLPRGAARKARERLVKEYGKKKVTADAKKMTAYVVLFTTVPAYRLSAEQLMHLYGLRWQVELNFKRDKSIAGLDELPNKREDTIHTWICAKLLGVQLSRRLGGSAGSFPPWIVGAFALRPAGFVPDNSTSVA